MINKKKYSVFCEEETSIPVFSQPWWLDIVCGKDNWDVILIEKGESIVASFPYYIKTQKRFNYIALPKLTQKLGPYVKYPINQKYEAKLSYEKKIFKEIIGKLPDYDFFNVNFDSKITNWLPFYWNDFKQTTRYSYVINDTSDLDVIVSELSKKNRQLFKRGIKDVKVVDNLSVEDFYRVCELTFKRQNIPTPYCLSLVKEIFAAGKKYNCGKPLFAVDDKGQIHSVSYEIWDGETMYSIIGGGDPALRNSGAKNLIFFEAIKLAGSLNLRFDFEGSMIESIEQFYRAFGARQASYFNISKGGSKKFRILKSIKGVFDAIKN